MLDLYAAYSSDAGDTPRGDSAGCVCGGALVDGSLSGAEPTEPPRAGTLQHVADRHADLVQVIIHGKPRPAAPEEFTALLDEAISALESPAWADERKVLGAAAHCLAAAAALDAATALTGSDSIKATLFAQADEILAAVRHAFIC